MSLPIPSNHAQTPAVRGSIEMPIRTTSGVTTARVFSFRGLADDGEHLALALGPPTPAGSRPLVRVHSECLTGDTFGSQRCDCGPQLVEGIDLLADCGGFLLYLRQEGRGIGLYAKIDAYALQDDGMDTFQANRALGFRADERDYTVAAQMLRALGVDSIDLLTNNPDKTNQLAAAGVDVREEVRTGFHSTLANRRYLAAKIAAGHHLVPNAGGIVS